MNVQPDNQVMRSPIAESLKLPVSQKKREAFHVPFSERRALLILVDTTLVLLAIIGAFILWQQTAGMSLSVSHIQERWYWLPILSIGWSVLAWLNDLYDLRSASRKSLSAIRLIIVSLMALSLYLIVYFFSPDSLPRLFVIYFLLIVTPAVTLWRWTYVVVFNALPFQHRVLIVGGNERGKTIAKVLQQEPPTNYRVLGFVDKNPASIGKTLEELPILGSEKDLQNLVKQLRAHEIVVAIERKLEKTLFLSLVECQANGIRVSWMPDLFETLCRRIPIQHVDPAWALHAMQSQSPITRLQVIIKRVLDLALLLLSLPIILFLIPFIALAIRLDSPGPIFYRQVRSGQAGQPFYIYKFRTMVTDAEKNGKAQWAKKNDPRITRVGRLLRKSRLDELPQLLNVLRGEMSIVGPRPERPEFVQKLEREIPLYRTRLLVRPGITGWAQVHYDYGNTVEDALIKLQYDFYYIRYQSLALDIYTMFRTVGVLLRLKGM
ncbi:MAG: sugar transferase [Chloroflexi bacterium]|nr:sugar transferase [Chloroflexota bacterium]